MASAQRRTAAEARRLTEVLHLPDTAEVRAALRRSFDSGKEAGREEALSEVAAADARVLLLDHEAWSIERLSVSLARLPGNTARSQSACLEAAALLRDAAKEGEPPDG